MAGQLRFAHDALSHLEPLLADDVELLLSHGNGPQVGHILTRVEEALGKAYSIPLEVCVAESEGELGYVLEQSLYNVLNFYSYTVHVTPEDEETGRATDLRSFKESVARGEIEDAGSRLR